jgi:hypothetical protein
LKRPLLLKIKNMKAEWDQEKQRMLSLVRKECDVILKRTHKAQALHDEFMTTWGSALGLADVSMSSHD